MVPTSCMHTYDVDQLIVLVGGGDPQHGADLLSALLGLQESELQICERPLRRHQGDAAIITLLLFKTLCFFFTPKQSLSRLGRPIKAAPRSLFVYCHKSIMEAGTTQRWELIASW